MKHKMYWEMDIVYMQHSVPDLPILPMQLHLHQGYQYALSRDVVYSHTITELIKVDTALPTAAYLAVLFTAAIVCSCS
jgi:hypothetical protein